MGGYDGLGRLPLRWQSRPSVAIEEPANKLELREEGDEAAVVPTRVRVEVQGGRDTASTVLRSYRLMREIEETGGVASVVELAAGRSALIAEVDGAQAASLARLPFVRRIASAN